jgi:orotidine-5'-phosphate decarboxylase
MIVSDRDNPVLDSPLIVALDYGSAEEALHLARQLDPTMVRLKVGKQLFTAAGPNIVLTLQDLGFEIFLDLKFHDIPNTVARAVAAAAELGVWMVNVHASGGSRMMSAARDALSDFTQPPYLVAVTVLTSMQRGDLAELGWDAEPIDRVCELAALAEKAGLDGVVCSAAEATLLSQRQRPGFLLVTPGIRQAGDDAGDQRRVVTPNGAMEAGATHLVVGRSITHAQNPAATATQIVESLNINVSR